MNYHFTRILDAPFDEAISHVTAVLAEQGFGVLTTIDVRATLKKKLDVDFRPYTILGACNPQFAYKALQCEGKIGTMLPCNVVVEQTTDGRVEVSAVDPIASMQAIDNPPWRQSPARCGIVCGAPSRSSDRDRPFRAVPLLRWWPETAVSKHPTASFRRHRNRRWGSVPSARPCRVRRWACRGRRCRRSGAAPRAASR